jgi:hypothetical protein
VRTPEERLRLFDRHVTELLGESAGRVRWSTTYDLVAGTMETTEPDREPLRSWLIAVRGLDAPGDDTYLPSVMDTIEGFPLMDKTRRVVVRLRQVRHHAQTTLGVVLEDSEGILSPRHCFELLAYVDHLHRNAVKEARLHAMDLAFRQMVRQEGVMYGDTLSRVAVFRDDPATTHLFEPAPPGTPAGTNV